MIGGLARRYARALAGTARSKGRLEAVAAEMERVESWLADPALAATLASPVLAASRRAAILAEMVRVLELSDTTRDFVSLLGDRHRISEIQSIAGSLREIADVDAGRIRGRVRVAQPIAEPELARLRAELERVHQRTVLLSVEIEPDLIGGISLEMEGRVFDGSARTQLRALARSLARGRSAA